MTFDLVSFEWKKDYHWHLQIKENDRVLFTGHFKYKDDALRFVRIAGQSNIPLIVVHGFGSMHVYDHAESAAADDIFTSPSAGEVVFNDFLDEFYEGAVIYDEWYSPSDIMKTLNRTAYYEKLEKWIRKEKDAVIHEIIDLLKTGGYETILGTEVAVFKPYKEDE